MMMMMMRGTGRGEGSQVCGFDDEFVVIFVVVFFERYCAFWGVWVDGGFMHLGL